jgi:hypothetical protein
MSEIPKLAHLKNRVHDLLPANQGPKSRCALTGYLLGFAADTRQGAGQNGKFG